MKKNYEAAAELFNCGFNCAQSVFAIFSEKFGMQQDQALKVSCGFGGGVRCGEICGAVSGAVMVIGLRYGQSRAEDQEGKLKCYAETVEFTDRFRKKNESIVCRDILGYDISTPGGKEMAEKNNLFKTTCVDMVISAVKTLEEMGY